MKAPASVWCSAGGLVATAFLLCQAASGQIIITNIPGVSLNDLLYLGTGGTPPDTMGSPGTNEFVEFINGAFAVYNKAGAQTLLITDTTFWSNAGISSTALASGLTDTRVIFDQNSGRWFASELTSPASGNLILLARSDTSDPAGTWAAVSFTANSGFGDFDTLGVDAQGVYLGVNDFDATNNFTGVSLFSIPKADLLASPPSLARMTSFQNLDPNTYGFTLQGANDSDPGPGYGSVYALDNQYLNQFERTTVNSPGNRGATLSSPVVIHCAYDGSPVPATQPSGNQVDAGDDRFSAAVRQVGGYVYIANVVTSSSSPHDDVHWMVVNTTNNTVTSEGIISDPNYDFIYPSIAANHAGQVFLAFNRIGQTAPLGDISICGALGRMVNGVVTMSAPFVLQPGIYSDYTLSFDNPPYRWGDYSATMFDPSDENLVWTIQEIPDSTTSYTTQIFLLSLATNRPALSFNLNGHTATLSWPLSADPGYVLQSSTGLPDSWWTTVTGATQTVNLNQRIATLTVTNQARYFRLKK